MDSIYKKLDKVRKPRVQISYDLENGGQTVKKELPFVVGVMGDYAGHAKSADIPFKERKFININGDNFNQVMSRIAPALHLTVKNTLVDKDENMAVDLKFNCMDDFEPDQIATQVPALKQLLDIRSQLHDLLSKADRSDDLEGLLEKILQDQTQLNELHEQLKQAENKNHDQNKTDLAKEKDND